MPLRLTLAIRETVAGHRLDALEGGGGGGYLPPFPMHAFPRGSAAKTGVTRIRGLRSDPSGGVGRGGGSFLPHVRARGAAQGERGCATGRKGPRHVVGEAVGGPGAVQCVGLGPHTWAPASSVTQSLCQWNRWDPLPFAIGKRSAGTCAPVHKGGAVGAPWRAASRS